MLEVSRTKKDDKEDVPEALDRDKNSAKSGSICKEQCAVMSGSTKIVIAPPSDAHFFTDVRKKELEDLMKNGTFKVVKPLLSTWRTLHLRHKIRWRVEDDIRNKIKKYRLLAQTYSALQASPISTKAPTVSRLGLRPTVLLAAGFTEYKSYVCDISQAYEQSESPIEHKPYLRSLFEMELQKDEILLALKHLYGIPESGPHWFLPSQMHGKEALGMQAAKVYPSVSLGRKWDHLEEVSALQVYDWSTHGSFDFLDAEEERCRFKSKPRNILQTDDGGLFNCVNIAESKDGTYMIMQGKKFKCLQLATNAEDFKSFRTAAQYIWNCVRPKICTAVQTACYRCWWVLWKSD